MDDSLVIDLREKWFKFDGSVREFHIKYGAGIKVKTLEDVLYGRTFKKLPLLGKCESITNKRIVLEGDTTLPMTALYVKGGKNNVADMIVAYHVQQGCEKATNMMYNKFNGLARMIIAKMMFKKNVGEFADSELIDDLVQDGMVAVIMQVKKSYKPNDGSVFHSYFTSIVKNTVKETLKAQGKSEDWLDVLPEERTETQGDDWNYIKATDSVV